MTRRQTGRCDHKFVDSNICLKCGWSPPAEDTLVQGGHFYGRTTPEGPLLPAPPGRPDAWICRRVADFPRQQPPAGAAIGTCATCGAPIAYNPARVFSVPRTTPRRCMQCSGVEPLPMEES